METSSPGRTDQQIVDQTNELAMKLLEYQGYTVRDDHDFSKSDNPRCQGAWYMACQAQILLTNTDPNDAMRNLEDDGPDVPDGHDWEDFPGGCLRFGCHEACSLIGGVVEKEVKKFINGQIHRGQMMQDIYDKVQAQVAKGLVQESALRTGGAVDGWLRFYLRHGVSDQRNHDLPGH